MTLPLSDAAQMDHALRLAGRGLGNVWPNPAVGCVITRDGRVIYGATWHDCPDTKACPQQAGYVVVDPHQSQAWRDYWKAQGKPSPKTCITQAEVLVERARFGRFHGLPE